MSKTDRAAQTHGARGMMGLWALLVTLWGSACTEAPTQIVVVVDPDESVGSQLAAVQVSTRREGTLTERGAGVYDAGAYDLRRDPGRDGHLILRPTSVDDTRALYVTVTGTLRDGSVVRHVALVRFQRARTLYLVTPLVAACARVTCPDPSTQTCDNGRCVAAVVQTLPETPLPRMMRDGSLDTMPDDLGTVDVSMDRVVDIPGDGSMDAAFEDLLAADDWTAPKDDARDAVAEIEDDALVHLMDRPDSTAQRDVQDESPRDLENGLADWSDGTDKEDRRDGSLEERPIDMDTSTDGALNHDILASDARLDATGEGDAPTFPRSCAELHRSSPSLPSGVYRIDLDGIGPRDPIELYCDMVTEMGGWTLAVRVRSDSSAHHTRVAVGRILSPTQTQAAKLSDADINLLRGDLSSSVVRFECQACRTYFQENQPFDATSSAGALMRCSASASGPWSTATAYAIHYGLNTYMAPACHYVIYWYDSAPNTGCYCEAGLPAPAQNGTLWVR